MPLQLVNLARESWRRFVDGFPKDATIYADDAILDALQWTSPGSLASLIARRDPHNIKQLPDGVRFPASAIKDRGVVVFLLPDLLQSTRDKVASVLQSGSFSDVHIYTGLDEVAHVSFEGKGALFSNLQEWVRSTVEQESADAGSTRAKSRIVVKIVQLPILCSILLDRLAVVPTLQNHVPLLEPFSEADAQVVAHTLSCLFTHLPLHEEIFAVGSNAQLVGRKLADLQLTRRSSSAGNAPCSVILVDRLLDIASPALRSDCFLDRLYDALSVHSSRSSDVSFDVSLLLGEPSVPESTIGNLSHGGDVASMELFGSIGLSKVKSAEMAIRKSLVELLSAKVDGFKVPRGTTTVLAAVKSLLGDVARARDSISPLGGDTSQLLQLACAAVVAEAKQGPSALNATRTGQLLAHAFADDPHQVHSQLADLLKTLAAGADGALPVRDILALALAGYSLLGDLSGEEADGGDEGHRFVEQLRTCLAASEGAAARDLNWLPGSLSAHSSSHSLSHVSADSESSGSDEGHTAPVASPALLEKQISLIVSDHVDELMSRLRTVAAARGAALPDDSPLRRLCVEAEVAPLVARLARACANGDPVEAGAVPAKGSTPASGVGLLNYITQGRDERAEAVFIVALGGVTFEEYRAVQEAQRKDVPIFLLGTHITTPSRIAEQALGPHVSTKA